MLAGQANQCWTVSASSWHLGQVSSFVSSSRCWYALSSLQCPDLNCASRAASFLDFILPSSLLERCSYVFETIGCLGGWSLISLYIIAFAVLYVTGVIGASPFCATSLAYLSASSFPGMFECPGIH